MKWLWVLLLIGACFYWGLWSVAGTIAALWVVIALVTCIICED